jgi:hypothetical protein
VRRIHFFSLALLLGAASVEELMTPPPRSVDGSGPWLDAGIKVRYILDLPNSSGSSNPLPARVLSLDASSIALEMTPDRRNVAPPRGRKFPRRLVGKSCIPPNEVLGANGASLSNSRCPEPRIDTFLHVVRLRQGKLGVRAPSDRVPHDAAISRPFLSSFGERKP